jgi:hypothetical protein
MKSASTRQAAVNPLDYAVRELTEEGIVKVKAEDAEALEARLFLLNIPYSVWPNEALEGFVDVVLERAEDEEGYPSREDYVFDAWYER